MMFFCQNLSKSFDDNILFDDISFEIKRGERVALIGNNGTGKTTLLKIINNLIPANSGEIQLGAKVAIGYYDQEHHVLDLEKHYLRKFKMLIQTLIIRKFAIHWQPFYLQVLMYFDISMN